MLIYNPIYYFHTKSVLKQPKPFKHPNYLLKKTRGAVKTVLRRAQVLLAIQTIIREVVPGDISVASFHEGKIQLITPSAALATRVKYSQSALIAALRQRKDPFIISEIKISVRPLEIKSSFVPPAAIPPSEANASHMFTAAQYIEDEPLRKALINLSKRAQPSES